MAAENSLVRQWTVLRTPKTADASQHQTVIYQPEFGNHATLTLPRGRRVVADALVDLLAERAMPFGR
jgi:hypothetical protein